MMTAITRAIFKSSHVNLFEDRASVDGLKTNWKSVNSLELERAYIFQDDFEMI